MSKNSEWTQQAEISLGAALTTTSVGLELRRSVKPHPILNLLRRWSHRSRRIVEVWCNGCF